MPSKTVLVCLDGSREAEAALPYAAAVGAAERAAICLLAVVSGGFEIPVLRQSEADRTWLERQQESAERYLDGKVSAMRIQGLDVSARVVRGDAAEQILRAIDGKDVTMVVMATHGRGGLQRVVLGSVADKVMRMSDRPTLLVRAPDVLGLAPVVTFRRLAVPLDGSPLAEQALPAAIELAAAAAAELLLVRAEQWVATTLARWDGEGAYVPNLSQMEEETATIARAYLAGVQKRLPSSIKAEVHVLRGFPVPELEAFFDQQRVDLVVMTTHARGGLPRLALGSTADRLVRDGCPTLLIHPTEAPAAREQEQR